MVGLRTFAQHRPRFRRDGNPLATWKYVSLIVANGTKWAAVDNLIQRRMRHRQGLPRDEFDFPHSDAIVFKPGLDIEFGKSQVDEPGFLQAQHDFVVPWNARNH